MPFDNKINKIMKKYLDPNWSSKNVNNNVEIKMNNKNKVYIHLMELMQEDFVKNLSHIRKIENPILYEQFKIKATECRLNGSVYIDELYHCTSIENVAPIIEDNFDWRLCSRIKYGQGISFSSSTTYANLQSNIQNGKKRAMIVADVIVGNKLIGDNNTIIPDDKYDTTVNKDNTVFVKYYDNEYYPKYVIYYETYPIISRHGQRFVAKN